MSGTPEEKRRADLKTVLLVDNSTWNLYNFRRPLIRCLRATGYRVLALAPPDGYAGLLNGLRLIPLRHLRARGRHIPSDLQLLAELYRHYSRLRPDLILHFTIKPNIFGSLAARQLGIRSVAVVTGLGYPFLRGGWLLGLVRVLYGQAMRASSQVVCYNAEDEVFLRDAGLVRPGQVAVIPGSGVDVHHFSPRLPGMGTPFRFLFVGRLLYDKGIREYVQAARRLVLRYPAVEWWILGEYNPDYPAAVKAEELLAWTCESSIRYLGQVRDVRPYLQNSCVVVLPSYREGLARSLQEALALARPGRRSGGWGSTAEHSPATTSTTGALRSDLSGWFNRTWSRMRPPNVQIMPIRIALIHNGPAFKPELTAYRAFFASRGLEAAVLRRPRPEELRSFDLEWHFTGLDRLPRQEGRIKVHEYTSSSIPPYARWKNRIKRQLNTRPDLRVFSNRFIRDAFGFRDGVPAFYREAPAVASCFLDCAPSRKPEFDLVYLGTLHRSRRAVPMLRRVLDRLPDARLLVVNALEPFLPPADRIHYTGLLPYEEVPQALRQARYGLNLVPNCFPFHRQASLKLAEYAALGLPVISTDYPWVRQFEAERRGRFFFLAPGMHNLSRQSLEAFDFRAPRLQGLRWEEVLDQSGVLPWLMERILSE